MQDELLCPMLFNADGACQCVERLCAWWDNGKGQCAMLSVAKEVPLALDCLITAISNK